MHPITDSATLGITSITDAEFALLQRLIFEIAGIGLGRAKKVLVAGRLAKRLKALDFDSYGQYFRHVTSAGHNAERQTMVDLLTTNETYFFREPAHFDFLSELASSRRHLGSFRVCSAASSSGEEAYTIAMVLAETLGDTSWEVVGTDISTQVLAKARRGQYPLERNDGIPHYLLKKYCLKGINERAGSLLISKKLRERVRFLENNLINPRHDLGQFDAIFLRNVMIYFDNDIKRKVLANLLPNLKNDGHLIIGHAESLNGVNSELKPLRPTIYRRALHR